ncbi:MAG: non-ribosomal peptide synthetase [Betaproteobacteria bacterium]|nr:non-ribosomal peptide synthetase [Betaproteobacteria bacterium]
MTQLTPAGRRVHEQVMDRAERTPDAIALVCGEQRLSYADLVEQACRIAWGLGRQGIDQDALIGVRLQRSPEMVACVLGVLMAGAAYLPLAPSDPDDRIALMLDDASPRLVLDDLRVVRQMASIAETASTPMMGRVGPDKRVYVIYTSGSTGRPKGVSMRHSAVENLIRWQIGRTADNHRHARLGTCEARGTLQYTPLTFDVSYLEIFSTLCAGRTLVVPQEDQWRDLSILLDLVVANDVGSIFLPFTVLNHLADFAVRKQVFPRRLFEIMTGGEQLRITPAIQRWFSSMPWCTLQNIYGPTEAHAVTTHNLRGDPRQWPDLPPIGRAIDNVTIHLLDERLQPVPAGARGEICIGGVSLADGYLHRPALTAERFVFLTDGGERLYRTGDLGHWLPDGSLMYDGRHDDQVKIQGIRLELCEVEYLLDQHPDVQQCVVVARDAPVGKQLVAYIVPRSTAAVAGSTGWREFLAGRLPSAAVPSLYVTLDELPLSSSGKVDRRQLPEPSRQRPALAQPLVGPNTPTEKVIAALWREHLQLDTVGIDDGFFELGGQSLLLVRIQNALSGLLGREVPILRLLQNPTVRALAADLDRDLQDSAQTPDESRRRRRQDIVGQARRGNRLARHVETE